MREYSFLELVVIFTSMAGTFAVLLLSLYFMAKISEKVRFPWADTFIKIVIGFLLCSCPFWGIWCAGLMIPVLGWPADLSLMVALPFFLLTGLLAMLVPLAATLLGKKEI